MNSRKLAQVLAERLSQLSGMTLHLKPYLTSRFGGICYEVRGHDQELTPHVKAKLIADLCRAQPYLIPSWAQKMRDPKALSMGVSSIGITDNGRILIPEEIMTSILFAFDPNQKKVLEILGKKLSETCNIRSGMRIKSGQTQLIITGQGFQESDYDTIQYFFSTHFPQLGILAPQTKPPTIAEVDQVISASSVYSTVFRSIANHQQKKSGSIDQTSVTLPLSSLNVLCKYFGMDFSFPYLGSEVNNLETYGNYYLQTYKSKDFEQWDFYKNIQEAEENLGAGTLNENLHSTDVLVCKKPIRARL